MAELRAWQPGYIDRMRYGIASLLGDDRQAMRDAEKLTGLLEYAPVLGDAMTGAEAVDEYNAGNYGTAGLLAAATAVGAVPVVGDAASKGIKKGIRAYHGSPHDFDKFDMSKIGTGEGAQAYGHGLYFAEKERVAKEYRDKLLDARIPDANKRISDLAREMNKISSGYRQWKPGQEELGRRLSAEYDALLDARSGMRGRMYEVNINANPEDFLDWDKPLSEQPESIRAIFGTPKDTSNKQARLAELEAMRPFDGSPEHAKLSEEYRNLLVDVRQADPKGSTLYRQLENNFANDFDRMRKEAGIPGIKYLDAGSRGANDLYKIVDPQSGKVLSHQLNEDGAQAALQRLSAQYDNLQIEPPSEATRNYVVFDDALIEILRKYGIAGLGLLGAGGAAYNSEQDGPAPLL